MGNSPSMSGLRVPHVVLILQSLFALIPGLIHTFHPDGGAKSIAGFTNYETCQPEILWAFRIIGIYGIVEGVAMLLVIYLSTSNSDDRFWPNVLRLFLVYQLCRDLLLQVLWFS